MDTASGGQATRASFFRSNRPRARHAKKERYVRRRGRGVCQAAPTETSTRAATTTALRHLLAIAQISRLKRHADVEVRIVSIPPDWNPPKPGTFVKETMNDLADLGQRLGADPASWKTDVP